MCVFVQYITACSIVFFDVPFGLFNIRRTKRSIKMMQGYHFRLCVHACTAFCRRTEKHTNITAVHLIEKCLLFLRCIIIVNESNFLFRHSQLNKLAPNIIIYIKWLRGHILNR